MSIQVQQKEEEAVPPAVLAKIKAIQSDDLIQLQFSAKGLAKKDLLSQSDPFLSVCRIGKEGTPTEVFKTEVIDNNPNPQWKQFTITSTDLYGGDPNSPIILNCWHKNSVRANALIGQAETTFAQLFYRKQFDLQSTDSKGKVKGNLGVLELLSIQVVKDTS